MDSRSLVRGKAEADAVATSPLELLLHVTLALVPILAVALVTLNSIQTQSIERIKGAMKDLEVEDIHELVIEIELQKLIDRYETVLAARELQLCLAAFPLPAKAGPAAGAGTDGGELTAEKLFPVDEDGFPDDPRFKQLCDEAQRMFGNPTDSVIDKLAVTIYEEAIRRVVDGNVMYDNQYHPVPAAVLAAHPEMPTVSRENREYALQRIGERIRSAVSHARKIQMAAVGSALSVAAQKRLLAFGGDEVGETEIEKVIAEVKENIHREFAARGLPLIKDLFAEKETLEN